MALCHFILQTKSEYRDQGSANFDKGTKSKYLRLAGHRNLCHVFFILYKPFTNVKSILQGKRGERKGHQGRISNPPCKIQQGDLGEKTPGLILMPRSPSPRGLLKCLTLFSDAISCQGFLTTPVCRAWAY